MPLYITIFSFLVSILLSLPTHLSSPLPYETSYRIDCGGQTTFTNNFNQTWLSDRYYTGGTPSLVAEPHRFPQKQEKTLRFFPISSGKKNCYILNVTTGRYYFRIFTIYDNYDGKLHSPSFDVSVEGTVVFPWRSPWPEQVSQDGAYSDLFAFVKDGEADVCFYSIATDPPVIGSLEIVQIDPLSYDSSSIGDDLLLVNYGRLTCGSGSFGFVSSHVDLFGRIWQSDTTFRSGMTKVNALHTTRKIFGTNQRPNYFPTQLYQSAVSGAGGVLEYELVVDAKLDYLLWFHFAEIDPNVNRAGQRVFDVLINQRNVTRIDIFKHVGKFAALNWHYIVKNLNRTVLSVILVPVVGAPLISGLENYALVRKDFATVPEQVIAMRALKESLKVPDRMGWNGDPCGPSSWDAWEGVTCHPNKDETGLIISQIDLGSQGLKGYISEQINLLLNLVSLNLSSNSLENTLPSGLGHKSLVRIDLSNNLLSGPIPDSLASSSLQLVLLNDNKLEGKVPDEIYTIGVHGGAIDLSGNKGLCGVPSLPACSLFWGGGGFSTAARIAIGLSCFFILITILVVICMCCIRRRDDYDFGPPQDLISIAANRNRYQRQKSLMLLEMESHSPRGYEMASNTV